MKMGGIPGRPALSGIMMQIISLSLLVIGTSVLLAPSSPVLAQEIEPRRYANVPVDLNFVGVGYGK